MTSARRLADLLAHDRIVVAPGAPDTLTARLAQRAGFPAVYMTGFGATASRLGAPDIGLLSQTEMTTHARDMVRAVEVPVIADADTGYGGPSNIHRTVREYLQAGVAAIHLEDQATPKRCGQMAGIRLVDAAESAARIACAVEARGDDALLIIARTDALPAAGADEALARAVRYRDAGADLVFVDGVRSVADVETVARRAEGPKVVSIVDGTEAASLTVDDLQSMGFDLALYAVTTLFTAVGAISGALAELARTGSTRGVSAGMVSYDEFCALVDLPFHQRLDDHYGR
jgi:2-methylisocitrate lyase-like PEP mutase family enzyme